MKRFIILVCVAGIMVGVSGALLLHIVNPSATDPVPRSQDQLATAGGGTALPAGGGAHASPGAQSVPDRLQRALADRDRQYHEAKIRLAEPALQYYKTVSGIGAEMAAHQRQMDRADAQARGAVNIAGQLPDVTGAVNGAYSQVQPLHDAEEDLQRVLTARTQFQNAFRQFMDDTNKVNYAFFKQFAEIYGSSGKKGTVPPSVDPGLDGQIKVVILMDQNLRDVIDYVSGGDTDIPAFLETIVDEHGKRRPRPKTFGESEVKEKPFTLKDNSAAKTGN